MDYWKYGKKIIYSLALIIAGFALGMYCITGCSEKPSNSKDSIYVYKTEVQKHTDTLIKEKHGRTKYIERYHMVSGTMPKDTIYKMLLVADTVIKLDTKIIARQDTIIAYQGRIIEFQGDSIEVLNSDLKKEKKKVKIFKVTTVAALLLNLFH